MVRRHVVITGHVQGVNFRFEAMRRAQSLGVTGWVRNRSDGSVELVAEGEADVVDQLVEWCRKGPSAAVVEDVEVGDETPEGRATFDIRH